MSTLLFNPVKLQTRRKRAANRCANLDDENFGFLHLEAAKIIAERLAVTNRTFNDPALLFSGPASNLIKKIITSKNDHVDQNFHEIPFPQSINSSDNQLSSEFLKLQPESIDLAISIFDLHWMNDLPGVLSQINKALKPDGLLMAVIPTEGTLTELRQSIISAEIEQSEGATSRIDPFPHIRQLGDLLQRTEFKLPVVDIEKKVIRYSRLGSAINDLRNAAATHASTQKSGYLSKAIWHRAKQIYKNNHSDEDGKLRATISLGLISGWKQHDSQQTPLKPGEAKNKFSDFL